MQDAAIPTEDPFAAGWANVRALLTAAISLFGGPCEILELRLLPRRWRKEMAGWLAPIEALVRRLLLLRATALLLATPDVTATPFPARRRATPVRAAAPPRVTPAETSAQWRRVRFVLIPRAPTWFAAPRPRLRQAMQQPHTAVAVAERLEALIRVAADPEPLARRLARRLRSSERLAGPRVARMIRPYRDEPDNPARDALRTLDAAVEDAVACYNYTCDFSSA